VHAEADESGYVLHRRRVGVALTLFAPVVILSAQTTLAYTLADQHMQTIGQTESTVVLVCFAIQLMSIVQQLTRGVVDDMRWTWCIILSVKFGSAWTNWMLLTRATPFVVDPITGRPNCMFRWAEWAVLAFVMAFVIDGTDSVSLRKPLSLGILQGVSTTLGACLPLATSGWTWVMMLATCILLFSSIYARLFARWRDLRKLQNELSDNSYHLCKVRLATRLNELTCFFWTLLAVFFVADVIARVFSAYNPSVNWGFIAGCVIDVVAKLYYADIVDTNLQYFPVRFRVAQGRVAAERMEAVWNDASDCIILSHRLANGQIASIASPSLAQFVGSKQAAEWVDSPMLTVDPKSDPQKPALPSRGDVLTLDELVGRAWWHGRFACRLTTGEDCNASSVTEVTASICDQSSSCVVVLRDMTSQDRLFEMEREALSASIERLKDEEANRFTRHEVKNGVLSAISQVDAVQSEVRSGISLEQLDPLLGALKVGLSQTLENVLSQALARDVVHGNYIPRRTRCNIAEVLAAEAKKCSGNAQGDRFVIKVIPDEGLPSIDVDRQLIALVYRNAISNACRYGKLNGRIVTEVDLGRDMLVIRVINEPGCGHEHLCELSESSDVFNKGSRLHPALALSNEEDSVIVSKGDGGWIMKRCIDCMDGTCDITFEASRTVFEMRCPAPLSLQEVSFDTMDLSRNVWAVGVEDSPQQRRILKMIFSRLAIPNERVTIIGDEEEELTKLGDVLLAFLERIPPDAQVLLIVDENLDVEWPIEQTISGSASVKALRDKLDASQESRLLSLVRSANDSKNEVSKYLERTHGFLHKAPIEPDRTSILRMWHSRFGLSRAASSDSLGCLG